MTLTVSDPLSPSVAGDQESRLRAHVPGVVWGRSLATVSEWFTDDLVESVTPANLKTTVRGSHRALRECQRGEGEASWRVTW